MLAKENSKTTCAQLRKLAKKEGIKCKDTKRLFWGLYGYYLKAPINRKWIEERQQQVCEFWEKSKVADWNEAKPSIRQIQRKYKDRVNGYIDRFINKNAAAFDADEFYTQVTAERMSFYVKSAEIAAQLVTSNPRFFEEISAPLDSVIEARLSDYADSHMEVKTHLWFAKFDYKIDFRQEREFDSLDERVGRLFLSESFYSIGAYTRTLYLAGEDEYFLVKLALKDKIQKVTCCVKKNEAAAELVTKAI